MKPHLSAQRYRLRFPPLLAKTPSVSIACLLFVACGSSSIRPGADPASPPRTATPQDTPTPLPAGRSVEPHEQEVRFANLRQLTFGGENAEAYWSPDGRSLIFQATREEGSCDQQYILDLQTGEETMVSTGQGRVTCGYFGYPNADYIVYSSTHHRDPACPAPPDRSQGYVWPLSDYDIFRALPDGTGLTALTDRVGYDAEATIRFDGSRIVFTSDRDDDLELYTMLPDGSDVQRITNTPGYDGGAFFSPDGNRLVWRAHHPEGDALDDFRALLSSNLVRPSHMEIFVADADGQNAAQVTANGAANFGPYFLPDSRRVVFASNVGGNVREFDLYIVDPASEPDADGDRPLERVTFSEGFDGFPMFSPNGRYIVFGSNRHGSQPGDTNLFLAEWRDPAP